MGTFTVLPVLRQFRKIRLIVRSLMSFFSLGIWCRFPRMLACRAEWGMRELLRWCWRSVGPWWGRLCFVWQWAVLGPEFCFKSKRSIVFDFAV
ncbi:hypothetical protein C8R44DRAFT_774064, partial [Mycena epipterygia]